MWAFISKNPLLILDILASIAKVFTESKKPALICC